jgi:hypothetical protein
MTFEEYNRPWTDEQKKWLTTSAITAISKILADWKTERESIPFRAILDWFMCSDPWPGGDHEAILKWLTELSKQKGYPDWVGAYHEYK